MSDVIRCPHCGKPVEIAQALTAGLRERLQAELLVGFQAKEREVEAKGKATAAREVALLQDQLKSTRAERDASQEKELALRKQREALDEERRALDLTIARQVDEVRVRVSESERKAAEEKYHLQLEQGRQQVAGMARTIEDLKRKAEQGSQQLQGEVQETSLEDLLKREFPSDRIEPVPKGVRGADVVQHVRGPGGVDAGAILWESKRTKAWAGDWLAKLRDDQRALKAEVAALVSQVLPAGAGPVGLVEGVWVAGYACAAGLAQLLRKALLDVASSRRSEEGRQEKMGDLYAYLTGPQFKGRVEGLLEPFIAMRQELDAEKRALEKIWARREKQIQRALSNVSGLHGDMEGIVGRALPEIRQLELPAPADDAPDA